MVRVHHVRLLCLTSGMLVTGVACKPTAPAATVSNSEPSVSNGLFTFSTVADGSVRVRPVDTSSSITKVETIGASMAVKSETITPSKNAVEIGSVSYTKFKYQLNGSRNCEWTTGMLLPGCTNAASTKVAQDSSSAEPAASTPSEPPNVTQSPNPLSGMTCGAHYQHQTKIWQKQFRVALTGAEAELDKIKEVRYTVDRAYGKTFVATNRADNFDAGSTFLTPVTSWDVDEAIVITKDGSQITLKWARLSWTDSDPEKKAGASCE